MNCTIIEQSKKLLELGLNPETADLIWHSVCYDGSPENGDQYLKNCYLDPKTNHFYYLELKEDFDYTGNKIYPSIPCWSLGALLEVIPSFLVLENTSCLLYVKKYNQRYEMYYANKGFAPKVILESNTLIEVAYNMMVWLLDNTYIEKECYDNQQKESK